VSATGRCHRLFEVQAVRDGRLTGPALDAHQVHVRGCAQCRAEARILDELSTSLRALPFRRVDELTGRRRRAQLLAMVNEAQIFSPACRRSVAWPLAAAVAIVIAVFAVGVTRRRDVPVRTSVPAGSDALTIESRGATWSRADDPTATRLRLQDGELLIHVDHNAVARRRLIVLLPDGELEDLGTTFVVRVESGHAAAVGVREGVVVLRRVDAAELVLRAGQEWDAEPEASVTGSGSAAPYASSVVGTAAPPVVAPSGKGGLGTAAASEFRDAVGQLESGHPLAAAYGLRAFLARHPQDDRDEDASYLLVVALRECGDALGSLNAAHAYLQRYPAGFRRSEVEALAR
jgi:hypothetical protein